MKRKILIISALIVLAFTHPEHSFNEHASAQEFTAWQKETRILLTDILYNGPVPETVPLEPVLGKHEKRDGYTLTEVKFNDRPGHVTTGRLARPVNPAADGLPAVLALHGHGPKPYGAFDPGHMYYYGDLLARKGYIVLAIDIDHDDLVHDKPYPRMVLLPKGDPFPAMGQRVWMARRAIDLLQEQPDVDPEKIAVVGLSNGGFTTMFLAAVEERVKLAVASGSLITHARMWRREQVHCRCQYMDRLDGVLDYSDVFALVAPRPLVIQSGEKDGGFPVGSARKAFKRIKKAYEIADAQDYTYHDVHDGAHEFRSEVPLEWFERYLSLPEPD
jgi:dipeptidyl aminopeptidase/acylaminoacyl peptidase